MTKKAMITGITGQDGAYLAQLLLEKGYEVIGAHRRSASVNLWRLLELGIDRQVQLVPMELLEFTNIMRVIEQVRPDEIYNLAAQSFVGMSFEQPIYTADVVALGVARLLEAVRTVNPEIRVYQASTSEMFGKVQEIPQTETTPFYPRSPYAVAKLYAHWMTVNHRESYGMYTCSGILFNHESPLRGLEFVTRKITAGFAQLRHGQLDVLELGNLDAQRDWGFAGDYVQGMWLMLQQQQAEDFMLGTGETQSVRNFVTTAAAVAGYDLVWEGEAENTRGIDRKSGKVLVQVNPKFYRPAEVDLLISDPVKAREKLGWTSTVKFKELTEMMVRADLDRAAQGRLHY